MRIFHLFPLLTLLLATPSAALAKESTPWDIPKLPFAKATIHYELHGMESGTEILYIVDHGEKQARHTDTTTKVMGMSGPPSKTIEVTDPDWITTYDLVEKTGRKMTNPIKISKEEYEKLTKEEKNNVDKNSKELGTSFMQGMAGETQVKGTKILGYDCDITKMGEIATIYAMHDTGIQLRSESSIMGMESSTEAIKVDKVSPIDPAVFQAPAGITVIHDQEAEAMIRKTTANLLAQLKHPDGAQRIKDNPQAMVPEELFTEENPEAEQPTQAQTQENPAQEEGMMKEMEQGMNMIKGLFSN